jgi:dTDP-4-dehydrorhamnose reductase
MRWLITGAGGQLGSDLQVVLAGSDPAGDVVAASNAATLDITDRAAVESAVRAFAPDVVINAAGYTAVDAAETDEDAAYQVNAVGPALLALATAQFGGRLIHMSTDYVFSGDAMAPYEISDLPAPVSVYGRTKLAGELAVRELHPDGAYVVRAAWVYGASGTNFVKTMARLEREHETVNVVDDQLGSPTWSLELARGLVELGRARPAAGTYHCTAAGQTTWFGLARAVFAQLGADPERVRPTSTETFPRPAARPAYSVLSNASWQQAGLTALPAWDEQLSRAFAEVGDALRG